MKKTLTTTVVAALLLGTAATASASELPESSESLATLEAVTEARAGTEAAVLDESVALPVNVSERDAITGAINGAEISVPTSPSEPITIDSSTGASLEIELPFSDEASAAEDIGHGLIEYDNGNGSTTVPVLKEGGSVQVTTIISGAEAPTEYRYELDEDLSLTLVDGVVLITGADGSYGGAVLPAWAVDVNGVDVPTRYEVEGSSLIQVVDHSDAFSYPVVADPWFGIDIWAQATTNHRAKFRNEVVYSVLHTPHGRLIYQGLPTIGFPGGVLHGQAVMRTAGWDEMKTKLPGVATKPTVWHQYECHLAGGYVIVGSGFWWDFERGRSNKPQWGVGAAQHRCNWTD